MRVGWQESNLLNSCTPAIKPRIRSARARAPGSLHEPGEGR
jgi:hypothetical protein